MPRKRKLRKKLTKKQVYEKRTIRYNDRCQKICHIIRKVVETEFSDILCNKEARYVYVYSCYVIGKVPLMIIRNTVDIWKYSKTVYQVFGRIYKRRKEYEYFFSYLKSELAKNAEYKKLKRLAVKPLTAKEYKENCKQYRKWYYKNIVKNRRKILNPTEITTLIHIYNSAFNNYFKKQAL